jgi:hypothetical protein
VPGARMYVCAGLGIYSDETQLFFHSQAVAPKCACPGQVSAKSVVKN